MGLEFAIDELYGTGWSPLDSSGCVRLDNGRSYPTEGRVRQEFADAGCGFDVRHVQLFDCFRAEWKDEDGEPLGAVVGQTAEEAAVYALSQFRRARVLASGA